MKTMNLKHYLAIISETIIFSLLTLPLVSCNIQSDQKNKRVKERLHALPFDRITLNGVADVIYTQDTIFSVEVEGTRKGVGRTIVRWEGSKLALDTKEVKKLGKINGDDENITIYVSSPDLIGIDSRGVGDFRSARPVNSDTLVVMQKGVGDIHLDNLVCDRLQVTLTGVGDFSAKGVNAQQSELLLKGVGDIRVHFKQSDRVDVRSTGIGDITVSGNMQKVFKSANGIGDVDVRVSQ
jgi:hypothetical protein